MSLYKDIKDEKKVKILLTEGPFAGQEWKFRADFSPDLRKHPLTAVFQYGGMCGFYEYRNIPPFEPAIVFVSNKEKTT